MVPDPADVATPLEDGAPPDFFAAFCFLFEGADPVQLDVEPDSISAERIAVLRGRVVDPDGNPLEGVRVTVLDGDEFGRTFTRTDGGWDMAVDGGGKRTVCFEAQGFPTVHRACVTPWRDFECLPDVVMCPLDEEMTVIQAKNNAPLQCARGSEVTDGRGTRRATVIFPAGTTAQAVLPDGSRESLDTLCVRVTEFTVGETGPNAMPATLPGSSAYTYCAEFSVDEAIALGATSVEMSQPVALYLENFLGFPVGVAVPSGTYDRVRGAWEPDPNGLVVKVLDNGGGPVELDVDGSGTAATADALLALGIDEAERRELASLYDPGQELWRVPKTHFSPIDHNWPYMPPADAVAPNMPTPDRRRPRETPNPCECDGSILEVQNQALGELLAVFGTPYTLCYRSDRVLGQRKRLRIPLTGDEIPDSLKEVVLEVTVLGVPSFQTLAPAPNLEGIYVWEGADPYGRSHPSSALATVRIGYVYDGVYAETRADQVAGFASFADTPLEIDRGEVEITLFQEYRTTVGSWDALGQGFGGWTLDVHHVYDRVARKLYRGDGTTTAIEGVGLVSTSFETDFARARTDVVAAPDGGFYYTDTGSVVRRFPDGSEELVAGGGSTFGCVDGPALDASLSAFQLALGPDGLYILNNGNCILRLDDAGFLHHVAGNASGQHSGDGGPATAAGFKALADIAVSPSGDVYAADALDHRIRRIDANGIITTVVGKGPRFGGAGAFTGDGGPAHQAEISIPDHLTFGPDGTLYFMDNGSRRIRKVAPDGIISTHAFGSGPGCVPVDGTPALGNCLPAGLITDLDADAEGNLFLCAPHSFFGDPVTARRAVFLITAEGILRRIAGKLDDDGPLEPSPDGIAALSLEDWSPNRLSVRPDGTLLVLDSFNERVHELEPAFPGFSLLDVVIPADDAEEVYRFDPQGRHVETLDARTGRVLRSFEYGAEGFVTRILEDTGEETLVRRAADGSPTAIEGPFGEIAALVLGASGRLEVVEYASGEAYVMTYGAGDQLESFTDPAGRTSIFGYDADGKLISDENALGDTTELVRKDEDALAVERVTPLGRVSESRLEVMDSGEVVRTNIAPDGSQNVFVRRPDGSVTLTHRDGTRVDSQSTAHPLWGMLAPYTSSVVVTTPDGRSTSLEARLEIELADPDEPFGVLTETETVIDNGKVYVSTLDVPSRTRTSVTPGGLVIEQIFDELGRLISSSTDDGVLPDFVDYDAEGRPVLAGRGDQTLAYGYDGVGRLATITQPSGAATGFTRDASGRPTEIRLASGRKLAYAYDDAGNPLQVTLPGGASYGLVHDAIDRLVAMTVPGGGTYSRSYDADGRWLSSRLPSGRTRQTAFDDIGNLTAIATADATTTFAYADSAGCCGGTSRLEALTRTPSSGPAQTIAFTYDGGNIVTRTLSGASNGAFAYEYDGNLAISSVSLDGDALAITRDLDGLVTGIGSFAFERSGPGRSLGAVAGAGMRTDYVYDEIGRLVGRTHAAGTDEFFFFVLGFDADGRTASRTETVEGVTSTWIYEYDVDGQMTRVTKDGQVAEEYAYDVDGNRILSPDGASTYDTTGLQTALGGVALTFDADGFLAQRGRDTFVYGTGGELFSATVGGETVTYSYDGIGRMTARTDASGTREFLYDELWGTYAPAASRAPTGELDRYLYDEIGRLLAFERDGALFLVGSDHLGSPRVVTDAGGQVVEVVEYDGWGRVLSDSNPGFELPLGFAGGIEDPLTGLVRFGMRDYDPSTGRWAARDPLLLQGRQANILAYCDNAPQTYVDPMGLATCLGQSIYFPIKKGSGNNALLAAGFGGKLCIDDKGVSVCLETGLAAGSLTSLNSTEIDWNAKMPKEMTYNAIGARVAVGPFGATYKLRFDECGLNCGDLKDGFGVSCYVTVFNLCKGKAKAPTKFLSSKFDKGRFWTDLAEVFAQPQSKKPVLRNIPGKWDLLVKAVGGGCFPIF